MRLRTVYWDISPYLSISKGSNAGGSHCLTPRGTMVQTLCSKPEPSRLLSNCKYVGVKSSFIALSGSYRTQPQTPIMHPLLPRLPISLLYTSLPSMIRRYTIALSLSRRASRRNRSRMVLSAVSSPSWSPFLEVSDLQSHRTIAPTMKDWTVWTASSSCAWISAAVGIVCAVVVSGWWAWDGNGILTSSEHDCGVLVLGWESLWWFRDEVRLCFFLKLTCRQSLDYVIGVRLQGMCSD